MTETDFKAKVEEKTRAVRQAESALTQETSAVQKNSKEAILMSGGTE
jgi:hypothetical protein